MTSRENPRTTPRTTPRITPAGGTPQQGDGSAGTARPMTQQQQGSGAQQGDARGSRDDRDQHQAGWTDVDADDGTPADERPAQPPR